MPYLETAQAWLTQSSLLLKARPSTTRITTKYHLSPPTDPNAPPKRRKSKPAPASTQADTSAAPATAAAQGAPEAVRATLTLKTYDTASGTTLKYATTKAAEVGRLVQILGGLARGMSGLPEVVGKEEKEEENAKVEEAEGVKNAPAQQAGGGGGGAGGKGKKKKGKR